MMTRYLFLFCFLSLLAMPLSAQDRILQLEQWLDTLALELPSLLEPTTISMRDASLAEYVRAIGVEHRINLFIADTPPTLTLSTTLTNEPVKSVFLFICKNFDYTLTQTGSILEFRPWEPSVIPEPEPEPLGIRFEAGLLSVDLNRDSLFAVIREISAQTGQKIITRPGVEGLITAFLPPTPLDTALEALFLSNGFRLQRMRKGYFLLSPLRPVRPAVATKAPDARNPRPAPTPLPEAGRLDFIVESYTDGATEYISVDAEDADLEALLKEIFAQTAADYLFYGDLQGTVSIHAQITRLDQALGYLFEGTNFTFKRADKLYLIGPDHLPGLQTLEIVKLKHRPTQQAIELIPGSNAQAAPMATRPAPRITQAQPASDNSRFMGGNGMNGGGFGNSPFASGNSATLNASLPPEIIKTQVGSVEIVDYPELNRIILKGPADAVAEIADFLYRIDQPVPMVKVSMIVVEVNKDRLLSTGLRAGLKGANDTLAGPKNILPGVDYSFEVEDINRLLGSIPALSDLGALKSNFYLQLKAQESRGNLKVNMQPVLSMLNGREASLTIGQTQYYLLETQTASNGAVNNFQQFTQRFERIEANITLTIKPYISDDGMVTLDVMPDFTSPVGGLDPNTPPTIATRRFASTVRVRDGDTVVLGGLSEERKGESTSGLPWLSRVPILKWFFGNVDKTKVKSSLLIYLTPEVYYN